MPDSALNINVSRIFELIYETVMSFGVYSRSIYTQMAGDELGVFIRDLKIALILYSLALLAIAFYAALRLSAIRQKTAFQYAEVTPEEEKQGVRFDDWQRVTKNVNSENPADWKLAVLEADNILDDITKKLNLVGETLGERLKNSDPSDFTTLNQAWEAHKVRNRIAHEGASYILTKREARRVVDLYEQVFKEFKMI